MILDNKGYLLITKFEGLRLKPYLCSAKIPTIGYGNSYYPDGKRVTLLDKDITKQEAFDMFKEVANRFAKRVDTLVTSNLNQNQFNALVSFAYNVGTGNFSSSTLLKKVNKNPDDLTIKAEFLRWNKAGGKVLNGLTNRRNEEADFIF
jgi:lysozyme